MAIVMMMISACHDPNAARIDKLNELSYTNHYRNLDSTRLYAQQALRLADSLGLDGAEALNNLAFVNTAKMLYKQAAKQLDEVEERSNNQVELLIADVQQMRLCQRESRNKDFYGYRERAVRRLHRIADEPDKLTPHQYLRLNYAKSEFSIVSSSYFYYVGLSRQSIDALDEIDPFGEIERDTAQLLCYWYNVGAGGILVDGTPEEIAQAEFDYLLRCYTTSLQHHYIFWQAQSLQAMSEHLQKAKQRRFLMDNNKAAIDFVNVDRMPDSLLAGNLAQRAFDLFKQYGDVYQIAGANRTLAECYWHIKDYRSALVCLMRALDTNKAINQAPDLVASIREQLSLVHSAVDDKVNSDRNRNIYLDLQEQTRQDRQLEARAGQLDHSSRQLNLMLMAVIVMIVVVIVSLYVFDLMRRRNDARFSLDTLLEPLKKWREHNEIETEEAQDRYDEIQEQSNIVELHLQQNRRRNIEQRTKIQLVNGIMPFIDRMVNEVGRLQKGDEDEDIRKQRYQYIAELTDSINEYNNVLTQWIQMRQGEVSLKIESFPLQSLFDLVARGRMSYKIKGINLLVAPTTCVVKADKTLTLFMINTIADNARKFTPEGGIVSVSATETPDYVQISVRDNGCGMTPEQLSHVFDRTYTGGHGFGLKNCYGIIEKYKKISKIFHVCTISAESEMGKGSHFFFRLPKGVARTVMMVLLLLTQTIGMLGQPAPAKPPVQRKQAKKHALPSNLRLKRDLTSKASQYADSAYFSNINGTYLNTLRFADSCHKYLAVTDTAILLDISNETAVAALALHRWDVYEKNNRIYTKLFREASSDDSLPEYVRTMQKSEANKTVAVILLILLLAILFPAYYFLYYRYRLNYRFCIDRINSMNRLLLRDLPNQEKLKGIDRLSDFDNYSVSDEQQRNLREIVSEIRNALQSSIDQASSQETSIELAEDNLRRLQMDNYQLHVSNSVLDNCLSTLKHETMYYPSRIRQLIDGADGNLSGIAELAGYYKELYQILSLQAVRQIAPLRLEPDVTRYLFDLLKKLNGGKKPERKVSASRKPYVDIEVDMDLYEADEEDCRTLFTPKTKDLKFMVCRQIVREMGELTNLRACGMMARPSSEGTLIITITMPERCWEQLQPVSKAITPPPADNENKEQN
ncbi:MAG: DUF5112 domain-containing protein [Prevotella sp.]|nr:DUF5112 domain-containing protein [Prevotella sp.]